MKIDNQELTKTTFRKILDLGNRDLPNLVRILGEVKTERKLLQTVEKLLITTVTARQNKEFKDTFLGWNIQVTKEGGRVTFDAETTKQEMGEEAYAEWWKAHSKQGEDFWKVTVTKVGDSAKEEDKDG